MGAPSNSGRSAAPNDARFIPPSIDYAKRAARHLQRLLDPKLERGCKLHVAQLIVAQAYHLQDWHDLAQWVSRKGVKASPLDEDSAAPIVEQRLKWAAEAIAAHTGLASADAMAMAKLAVLTGAPQCRSSVSAPTKDAITPPATLSTTQPRINARTFLNLPADVMLHRQVGSDSGWLALRHSDEGLLGRVRVVGAPAGPYRIDGEVSGDREDPATQRRMDLLRRVTEPLLDALSTLGDAPDRLLQDACEDSVVTDGAKVDPQAIPCARCGQPFAFHVYCAALTPAAFADVARLTFRFWGGLKVPTWIIGAPVPDDIKSRRHADVRCAISQVWPERGGIELLAPADFNPKMRDLEGKHCKR